MAADGYANLPGYGELALSMHVSRHHMLKFLLLKVMANYHHLLEKAPATCLGARLLAHLFTARRRGSFSAPIWLERLASG